MNKNKTEISMFDIWNVIEPNCDGMKVAVREEDLVRRDSFPGYNQRMVRMETFICAIKSVDDFWQIVGLEAETYSIREFTICSAPITGWCTPKCGLCADCKQQLKIVMFPEDFPLDTLKAIEIYNNTDSITTPISYFVDRDLKVKPVPQDNKHEPLFPEIGEDSFKLIDRKVTFKSTCVF